MQSFAITQQRGVSSEHGSSAHMQAVDLALWWRCLCAFASESCGPHPEPQELLPYGEGGGGDVLVAGAGGRGVCSAHRPAPPPQELQRVEAAPHVALRPVRQRDQRLRVAPQGCASAINIVIVQQTLASLLGTQIHLCLQVRMMCR